MEDVELKPPFLAVFKPEIYTGIVVTRDKAGNVSVSDTFAYRIKQCAIDTLNDSVAKYKDEGVEVVHACVWDMDLDGSAFSNYGSQP